MPSYLPKLFLLFIAIVSFSTISVANDPHAHGADSHATEKKFNAGEVIMHHITDSHEWHFFTFGETHVTLSLPTILYNTDHGLRLFSFKRLHENGGQYDGYYLDEKHHIQSLDGSKFYDFSITKNVLAMMISAALLLLIFLSVAGRYRRNPNKAPNGFQNFIEVIVLFVRDETVKPMLGRHTNKYLPYLLTVFFFIWINNLMGLLPGSANVTGNIAVTMTLAVFTFIIMMVSSSKAYWHHLLTAPGTPFGVKIILVPVEILSIFTKPFALLIRLFANMTAGHLIVLSFLSLIFIFADLFGSIAGYGMSLFSIAFSTFIYCLELLVAVLQAYIFTILSALFISEAIADHGHGDEAHGTPETALTHKH